MTEVEDEPRNDINTDVTVTETETEAVTESTEEGEKDQEMRRETKDGEKRGGGTGAEKQNTSRRASVPVKFYTSALLLFLSIKMGLYIGLVARAVPRTTRIPSSLVSCT